jgi:hypothetical protein
MNDQTITVRIYQSAHDGTCYTTVARKLESKTEKVDEHFDTLELALNGVCRLLLSKKKDWDKELREWKLK